MNAYAPAPGPTRLPPPADCSMSITFAQLQPGDHLSLGFSYTGNSMPHLVLLSTAKSSGSGVMVVSHCCPVR